MKSAPAVFNEAHCISEWGHDFRPDYLHLGKVIGHLDHPTVIALSATVAAPVRSEIIDQLGMHDPAVVVLGFDRPNIRLAVETFRNEKDKRAALIDRLASSLCPGIVYAATRRDTEELAVALTERGITAAAYHAGLKAVEREAIQSRLMDDEIEPVLTALTRVQRPVNPRLLQENTNLSDTRLTRILDRLEDVHAVEVQPDRWAKASDSATNPGEAAAAAVQEQNQHRSYTRSRLEMMRQYAELTDCRRRFLLNYFGEAWTADCGSCDICESGVAGDSDAQESVFPQHSQMVHASLGEGAVIQCRGDTVVVLFEKAEYRTLSMEVVTEQGLLQLVNADDHQAST